MAYKLAHGMVIEHPRKAIHVVRIIGETLETWEIDALAEQMRRRLLSRTGEQAADVVVVQGDTRETLRIFGDPYSVSRVRTAMFNAGLTWSPIRLD
jgi:hypothetical protein